MTHRQILALFAILYSLFSIPVIRVNAQNLAVPESQKAEATPSALTPPPPPTTGINLIVSPPVLDIRTEPGASFSAVINVKNNNPHQEALQIDLMKFVADETGARPKLMPLEPTDIFPQWIELSETKFTIEGTTWKPINFAFNPPANAAPAYFFAIVINRQNEITVEHGEVAKGAVAILGLAQVNSSRVYHQLDLAQLGEGKGLGFKTDKYIYEFLPVQFTTTITNTGNVHERAFGNIFMDWVSGNRTDIDIINVNEDKSAILPQSTRTFENTWSNGFPHWETVKDNAGQPILNNKGQPQKKLVWDFSKLPTFRIGKYRATLTLAYNDGVRDIPLEAQTEFWVIPWRILAGLLVLLVILIIGLKGTIQSTLSKLKSARDRINSRMPPPTVNP